jgi:hypothetical protein
MYLSEHMDHVRNRIRFFQDTINMTSGGLFHFMYLEEQLSQAYRLDCSWHSGLNCGLVFPFLERDSEGGYCH